MITSQEVLFGVRTLTGMIKTFADDSRDKFFTQVFERGERSKVEGNTFEWDEVRMSRKLAPIVGSSSPAPQTAVTDRAHRTESLVEIKHFAFLPGDRLYRERAPGELKPNATAVVANELENLRLMIGKTLEFLCVSTLTGDVEINPTTCPGTDYTASIKYDVSSYKPAVKWTDPTAPVVKMVSDLTDQYMRDTGRAPGSVLHNVTVEQDLLENQEVQKLCANQAYAAKILLSDSKDNRVLDGLRLGNLEWRKSLGYYDENGTLTKFCPDQTTIVLPEEQEYASTLGLAEGFGLIPRNAYGTEGDLGIFELAEPGYYAYSVLSPNPVGIQLFAGWRGLPYLRFPKGIQVGQVG